MADIVHQLDIFGNEDPVLKGKEFIAELRMKDGSTKRVVAKPLTDELHYHKEDGLYWLTKTSSGVLITSAKTIKALKELIQEPEFFDEPMTREGIIAAVNRWGNRRGWK